MWTFKELLWDSGIVWVIIIIMFISWIINRTKIMIDYYKKKNNKKQE